MLAHTLLLEKHLILRKLASQPEIELDSFGVDIKQPVVASCRRRNVLKQTATLAMAWLVGFLHSVFVPLFCVAFQEPWVSPHLLPMSIIRLAKDWFPKH